LFFILEKLTKQAAVQGMPVPFLKNFFSVIKIGEHFQKFQYIQKNIKTGAEQWLQLLKKQPIKN